MRPDRCCDEPPGVPTTAPPADLGWAGEGPAEGGPLLLGVIISLLSSSPSCLPSGILENPPAYCVEVTEVDESMVLVLLPLIADRDIEVKAFGVSGGEKGVCCNSCSTGGDKGVLGKGFSRLRSLVLRACFFMRRRSEPADAGLKSWFVEVEDSPVCIFEGLVCAPDIDPSFLIPLRTPEKKSTLSGEGIDVSSSAAELDEFENLDESCEPAGRRVSFSDMITHAWGRSEGALRERLEDITKCEPPYIAGKG